TFPDLPWALKCSCNCCSLPLIASRGENRGQTGRFLVFLICSFAHGSSGPSRCPWHPPSCDAARQRTPIRSGVGFRQARVCRSPSPALHIVRTFPSWLLHDVQSRAPGGNSAQNRFASVHPEKCSWKIRDLLERQPFFLGTCLARTLLLMFARSHAPVASFALHRAEPSACAHGE